MDYLKTIEELEALYPAASVNATRKVARALTPAYRKWIMSARFCVISSIGAGGTDGSPRGDLDPVVREIDAKTLAMPDWPGNNRIDTLRNIVDDGRLSLLFMVPGEGVVVRVNGVARITADDELRVSFARNGKTPRAVIVIKIGEIYAHCARAIMRSELWGETPRPEHVPTLGTILAEMTDGEIAAQAYDDDWVTRGPKGLW